MRSIQLSLCDQLDLYDAELNEDPSFFSITPAWQQPCKTLSGKKDFVPVRVAICFVSPVALNRNN